MLKERFKYFFYILTSLGGHFCLGLVLQPDIHNLPVTQTISPPKYINITMNFPSATNHQTKIIHSLKKKMGITNQSPSQKSKPSGNKKTATALSSGSTIGLIKDAPLIQTSLEKPIYPESSRKEGQEGEVILKVIIDEKGYVTEAFVEKSSNNPAFDDSAIQAAKKSRFHPSGTHKFLSKNIRYRFKLTW